LILFSAGSLTSTHAAVELPKSIANPN